MRLAHIMLRFIVPAICMLRVAFLIKLSRTHAFHATTYQDVWVNNVLSAIIGDTMQLIAVRSCANRMRATLDSADYLMVAPVNRAGHADTITYRAKS